MLLRSPIAANAKLALCELIGLRPAGARILDRYLACRIYRRVYGRYPDPTHPALFSDKTSARKLFDRRDIFPLLADKLMTLQWWQEDQSPDDFYTVKGDYGL